MGEKSYRKPFVARAEKINHPSHYINDKGEECFEVMIREFGVEKFKIFCELNAFKYNFRAGKKYGESEKDDKDKANWYTNKYNELNADN